MLTSTGIQGIAVERTRFRYACKILEVIANFLFISAHWTVSDAIKNDVEISIDHGIGRKRNASTVRMTQAQVYWFHRRLNPEQRLKFKTTAGMTWSSMAFIAAFEFAGAPGSSRASSGVVSTTKRMGVYHPSVFCLFPCG